MRYLILGLLVLLSVGQHAALSLVPVDSCCEPDEAASPDGCATTCALCICCLERTPVDTPVLYTTFLSLASEVVLIASPDTPPSPEPAEILHVPKPLLA